MSTKQLARTVLDGRKVTFNLGFEVVTGYLCGMDDFHWAVITPHAQVHLVHKSAPLASIESQASYANEPTRAALEKVVGPFRATLTEDGLIRPRVPATEGRRSA